MKKVYMTPEGDLVLFSPGGDGRGYTCDNMYFWISYTLSAIDGAELLGDL